MDTEKLRGRRLAAGRIGRYNSPGARKYLKRLAAKAFRKLGKLNPEYASVVRKYMGFGD